MLKINRKTTILLAYAGSIISLVGLLIFVLLPTSDLANSIEHSAKDALMVFILSPVCALIGSLAFIFATAKDFKVWVKFTEYKSLVTALTALFAAFSIYEIAFFTSYLAEQFSLGFVAPYSGTIYDTLAFVAIIFVALKFVASTFLSIAVIRNKLFSKLLALA